MSFRKLFIILILAGAVFLLYRRTSDPHATVLPFGTTDLSKVQKQMAKLPAEERALVEAYVKRSRGDVLPPKFADPDVPLTARTFGEAIVLQRDWSAKMKVMEARAAELRAERDAKLAPLRAVVDASVVKAEIITRNEYQARRNPSFSQQPYTVDKSLTFITLIRVENRGAESIAVLRGSLQARDSEAYLPLDLCWIDHNASEPIRPGAYVELTCGHDYRGASEQQQAFVNNPEGRFRVEWEPRYVKFANGRELNAGVQ